MNNGNENYIEQITQLVGSKLSEYVNISQSAEVPVIQQASMQQIWNELSVSSWIENGGMRIDQLNDFLDSFFPHTMHMHHPAYMGHQVAVPHFSAVVGDMINSVSNNPMAIYEMGPASAAIEAAVINWMLQKTGWLGEDKDFLGSNDQGAGVLTHGGSLANLTALLAARNRVAPSSWENGTTGDLVILCSPSAHYSIARAISIMGLGSHAVVPLEVDEMEVLKATSLRDVYDRVISEGKRVMAVVASACATSTGLYDPIDVIADFCLENKLWLHIDGPHGMAAILSKNEKKLLKGIEKADSVIWDAHKMLCTSTLCTAVLFKDKRDFNSMFQQEGSYLFHEKENHGYDFIEHTIECTKAGLGLKLFFVLAFLGEKGISEFVENQYDKTKEFHKIISERKNFQCPYVPQSNILCFRYGNDNNLQLVIREELLRKGDYYITLTEIRGLRYLRIVIMNPATDKDTIYGLLKSIEEIVYDQMIDFYYY
ncbi:MAG TPA: pyridoxal-dependent decarboxylase [Puia sp.]|nr:pyridoxal-dependent decarboxylase [Puia sp.]